MIKANLAMAERRYIRATAFERAFNAVPAFLARLGISLYGSRLLAVRGHFPGTISRLAIWDRRPNRGANVDELRPKAEGRRCGS
jgi:hypothetical protein